ncbi:MAG: hypothetical protein ACI9SC_001957 [Gammaproteobacteria bacterium]|jgi:hypothetical protein
MENENLARIKRISGKFRLLFTVLLIFIPVMILAYWLFFNDLPEGFTSELPPLVISNTLALSTRLLAFIVSLIPTSIAIYGIFNLRELFTLYEKGIIFTTANVKCIRRLGYALIYWTFSKIPFMALISIVLSHNNPPGERMVSIGFGSTDFVTLVTGAIVLIISWVMSEASKLEDEQAHTV